VTDDRGTALTQSFGLGSGVRIPVLGLGLWQIPPRQTELAVRWALEAGYRHFDTAALYRNEAEVGAAVRASGLPREEVFVTTKFLPRSSDPEQGISASLRALGFDYVDLYLIHWPTGEPTRFWDRFERFVADGRARSIGVSNYDAGQLRALIRAASVPPAVNQVEFNPFQYRRRLLEACRAEGVVLEAYSPLTRGRELNNPVIVRIAEQYSRTPAQVVLRWALQHGTVVIPKSANRDRIRSNAQIFDFEVAEADMAALNALDRTGGTDRA
jgi:diketogulonate reductase-like aldo/keto reductase